MIISSRQRLASVTVTALFVVVVAVVVGATAAKVCAEEGETAEVRALLTEAVSEYDAHRYEEARALFRRVHQIAPSARALRGIGMASFELRDYVQALQSLEGALAEQRRALTAEQRKHVERLIERTNAYLGRFVVNLSPRSATLRIDGQTAAVTSGSTLMLGFGSHTLSADAPGFLPQSRELTVMGGERQDMSFELRPAEVDPSGERIMPLPNLDDHGGGAGAGTPLVDVPPPEKSHRAIWFAAAGALAVGAIGAGVWAYQLSGELGRCRDAGMACLNQDTLSGRRNLAVGVTVGLTAGAAALAVVGSVVGSKKPQSSSGTTVACAPGPGTVQCAFIF